MTEASREELTAGAAYEKYMGRWSRPLARAFLEWLHPPASSHWLEVGCGTGSLTATACALCDPAAIVACDPSAAFIEHAQRWVQDDRASYVAAGADALPTREGGFDVVVSGLVLNFLPEPALALQAMRERVRVGGTVAAYVWDYAGGMEFLRTFWEEAVAANPEAAAVDESQRFAHWQATTLAELFKGAELTRVEARQVEIPTRFAGFDDFWSPFLGATGPAPSYVASLDEPAREALKKRLRERLPVAADGTISLRARAWAARGIRAGAPPAA